MTTYSCRGCGEDVGDDESQGFAGDLTEHDSTCANHTRNGRCAHPGACYEENPA